MRIELAGIGIGLAIGYAIQGMSTMIIKNNYFKNRRGCRTCRYESESINSSRCKHCEHAKGSHWTRPKKECPECGQVVE